MAETVSGGAALAWRLLATLEGGSLVLVTTALLAYTARSRGRKERRNVRSVLITNTIDPLGRKLKRQLESRGCTVSSLMDGATSGACSESTKVDALIVVGAQPRASGLEGLAELVSKDVYDNLKMLDALSPRVRRGGYMAWACAGSTSGAFSAVADAFDTAVLASLQHVAKSSMCEPVFVGRCESVDEAANSVVAALVTCPTQQVAMFSIRNAANKVSSYVGRWLKIVT